MTFFLLFEIREYKYSFCSSLLHKISFIQYFDSSLHTLNGIRNILLFYFNGGKQLRSLCRRVSFTHAHNTEHFALLFIHPSILDSLLIHSVETSNQVKKSRKKQERTLSLISFHSFYTTRAAKSDC